MMTAGLTLFRAVLTVLGVLLLAYWCSRMLGKRWTKSSCSANLHMIESIQVGQDKRILLLKVGEHNYLIGVSQAGIQLLAEVEGDFEADMPPVPEDGELPSFQILLEKYLTHRKGKDGVDR